MGNKRNVAAIGIRRAVYGDALLRVGDRYPAFEFKRPNRYRRLLRCYFDCSDDA